MDVPARHATLISAARGGSRRAVARGLALAAAFAAALLLILPLALRTRIAEYDEAVFLDAARNVQRIGLPLRSAGAQGAPLLEHTPLYAFLLSLYTPQTGAELLLPRGVTALAALFCVFLTYRIAAALGGRRAGVLAAALAALNPFLAVYAYFVRMEMFMVAAMLVALYLLVRRRPLRTRDYLGAGLALAVATLFKEFALILVFPAAVFAWATGGKSLRARAGALIAVAAPPLLALVGWALWANALWPTPFAAAMRRWLNAATGAQVADPRAFVSGLAWSRLLIDDLFGPGLALGVLAAGVWAVARRRRLDSRAALLWAYLLVALGLSFAAQLREPRHLMALIPVAAALVGLALADIWREARAQGPALRGAAAAGIALLLVLSGPARLSFDDGAPALTLAPSYRSRLNSDAYYGLLARAGAEAARLSAPGEVLTVAHQGPVIAYYADRRYLMLYTMDEPAIQRALARARLLVWDEPVWQVLPADRVPAVEALVAADFMPLSQVSDGSRVVTIYRRKQ